MAQRALTIERIYQEMELELLKEVASLINAGELIDTDTNAAHWKSERLRHLGKLNQKSLEIIARYTDKAIEEVASLIEEAGIAEIEQIQGQMQMSLDAMGREYIPQDSRLFSILELLKAKATDDINLLNASVMRGTRQIYRDILTKGASEFVSGRRTLYDATIRIIKEWGEQGIPVETGTIKPFKPAQPTDGTHAPTQGTGSQPQDKPTETVKPSRGGVPVLVDKNGRQLSVEGYVATTLRATQKALAVALQDAAMDEHGIDLVELSSHAGSRPSHVPFQGRIYSRSGTSEVYPPLASTGYGTITGMITGINCRHQMYPFEEGVSTQRYKPYDPAQSLIDYKNEQQQRALERSIRKAKKKIEMLKSTGAKQEDIDKAKRELRDRQKKIRDFLEKTGLGRNPQRERIATTGGTK